MVVETIDPYGPCPCGSGRKYKFCCRQKRREQAADDHSALRVVSGGKDFECEEGFPNDILVGDLHEGRRWNEKGLALMGKGKFRQAVPCFEKAHHAAPFIPASSNNWALCLMATAKLDEAFRVQREGIAASPLPNPFGLANLSAFHLIRGEEEDALRCLNKATAMKMPTADACVKVCETLARYGRHEDILSVADRSGFAQDDGLSFYTGVAAANLGKRARALADLGRVAPSHPKSERARRYLEHLREKSAPHTVRGDWPYLDPHEVCPFDVVKREGADEDAPWYSRRIAVHLCEAMLNEAADHPENILRVLSLVKHPDATDLLWTIVKGSFGPDAARMGALVALQQRGEVRHNQKIDILQNGKRTPITAMGTQMNPELRFGGKLPPKLDKLYTRAVLAAQKQDVDWARVGEEYLRIMREAPDFYPARFNYAVSLRNRGRDAEAVPILRELVEKHPAYLFAPAALLQILSEHGRDEEAEALLKSVALPEETHPSAMSAWLAAQTYYSEKRGDYAAAERCIDAARNIDPQNRKLQRLWRQYK
jgi:tetratricopeptide (TPR) repeat protein